MKLSALAIVFLLSFSSISSCFSQESSAPGPPPPDPSAAAPPPPAGPPPPPPPPVSSPDPAAAAMLSSNVPGSSGSASMSSMSGSSESSLGSGSRMRRGKGQWTVSGAIPDPLNLGTVPPGFSQDPSQANTLPPYNLLNGQATVSPNLVLDQHQALSLDLDRRIKVTEDLLNRMVWQLNRETSWANSVHDIIQNYQYKYTKVLSTIKKHTDRTTQMRDLLHALKKAKLHETLEEELVRASRALTELASGSSETSADQGSYAAVKDRVALIKADLEKISHTKVNKVLNTVQTKLKQVGKDAIPPPSSDTLKSLIDDAAAAKK